jgi:hypothetical protein
MISHPFLPLLNSLKDRADLPVGATRITAVEDGEDQTEDQQCDY